MKKVVVKKVFGLGFCVVMLCAAPAFAEGTGEQTANVARDLQEIPDAKVGAYIAKSNALVELLNESIPAVESWQLYRSWVNLETGPVENDDNIAGLRPVGFAGDAIEKARQSATAQPAIPPLDAATKELAETLDRLVPIMNEAAAYYRRKDYLTDHMKGGKELHAKLVPAAKAFLAARANASQVLNQVKSSLDRRQLASIEKAEGKSLRWHKTNTMMLAKKAIDQTPRDPHNPGDLKAFDQTLGEFGDAVRAYDSAVQKAGQPNAVSDRPSRILGSLREIRAMLDKDRVDEDDYDRQINAIVHMYNTVIDLSNRFGDRF